MVDVSLGAFATDLTKAAEVLRNTESVMGECARIVAQDMDRSTGAGVSVDGTAFTPLAHPRASGNTGPPLNDFGLLRLSLIGGPDHVESFRKDGFTIGTRRIGAPLMQFGGYVAPVRAKYLAIPVAGGGVRFSKGVFVPARPFVGISEAALKGVIDKLTQRLTERIA